MNGESKTNRESSDNQVTPKKRYTSRSIVLSVCVLLLVTAVGSLCYYPDFLRELLRELIDPPHRPEASTYLRSDYEWYGHNYYYEYAKRLPTPPEALRVNSPEELPRIDGATGLFPVYAALAEAFVRFPPPEEHSSFSSFVKRMESHVKCSRTGLAYNRLIAGETDMIFVGEPSDEHRHTAAERGVELVLEPIGCDAFVFFVSTDNPVTGLTLDQIRAIYTGQITNWKAVGGLRRKIVAYQRGPNTGSQIAMQALMDGIPLKQPLYAGRDTMGDVVESVAYHPEALGYSFMYFLNRMTKMESRSWRLLTVDGVMPERSSIVAGAYPLAKTRYVVRRSDANPEVIRFIEWVQSPAGQSLVEKVGYTPVGPTLDD